MLSLYIHIPFCARKCSYCSFMVMPESELEEQSLEQTKDAYLNRLIEESSAWAKQLADGAAIRTIHIGGWTPFQLGAERLKKLLAHCMADWNVEFLEELTIEINPDPFDEVLAFIEEINTIYQNIYKVRRSIGLQSFDDEILAATKRQYNFAGLQWFLRALPKLKKHHVSLNGDFIAFGKTVDDDNGEQVVRWTEQLKFFLNMVKSGLFDGFSLYSLELIPWSNWFNESARTAQVVQKMYGSDDAIIEEFHLLRDIIKHAGYKRYELSNFAKMGKGSIHNMVYWTDGSYLGLGINSSSYFNQHFVDTHHEAITAVAPALLGENHKQHLPVRFKNTIHWKTYLSWSKDSVDEKTVEAIDEKNGLREQAVMSLRCGSLHNLSIYDSIKEPDFDDKLAIFIDNNLLAKFEDSLIMTQDWYDLFNHIVTDLFVSVE